MVAVVNNYTFVLNDPIEWTDPTGLKIGSGQVHGNWCGGDWTGGLPEEYNPADEGLHKAPTDALDTACQTHDKCYFKCREQFPCQPEFRSDCFSKCDAALAAAARSSKSWDATKI